MGFAFHEPKPLVDAELELIAPEARWVDPLLKSCAHPGCTDDPGAMATNYQRVMDFLKSAPRGHQPADISFGRVPAYHFWMRLRSIRPDEARSFPMPRWGSGAPPIEIAGGISLRVGYNDDLERYAGHIGYNVYPPARGHHYAERACRLIFSVARMHGMRMIWITCNPDNWASRRTCERLGCHLADIVPVPSSHTLYQRGDREKCRYWIEI